MSGQGMKQVGLLPAGCQPWNADVCAASGDRFAYCATLAVYIYQLDRRFNEFKLHCIMSAHKKTITAVAWHPTSRDLIASCSTDKLIVVYHVGDQNVLARITISRAPPTTLQWLVAPGTTGSGRDSCVAFASGRGPLSLWNYMAGDSPTSIMLQKDVGGFSSDICTFRLHPKKAGKTAVGHVDGSISLFNTAVRVHGGQQANYTSKGQKPQKHILRPGSEDGTADDEQDDPVCALEWDPLSVDYLLMANTHSGVRLIDASGQQAGVIMTFTLPSAAAQVHTLAWISSAPGMFVTGDSHTGTMRVWTVAKSTPLENLKLKKTGFHALHVFHTAPGQQHEDDDGQDGDTSPCLSPSGPVLSPTNHYTIPPAFAVCTFLDGGVGLYDLSRRRWYFLRDQGHIETIFDCKFKPDNSDLLATGSFDGTIKIWDVNTLKAVQTSPGNEGVIYSLSWAPADLNCIAAGTSRHGAFLWDVTKGKVIKRFNEHGKASVYSVAWNHKESRRIATAAADGYCIIRQVDGLLLAKYKHPGAVYGCDWSPNNKDMLATGCEDKCVRVFYLPSSNESCMRTFSGHTAKVFHVKWSPLRDGLLASGSDDGTVRVWDYSQENTCLVVLQGHTAPVRGLLWNPEVPYLMVSGSWDYTIRVWDIRDGACIDTSNDHGADVYGLTSHPAKPFTMASCSRDSTVRILDLSPLVQPLAINILAAKPWDEILSSAEHSMAMGTPPLLCGRGSKELKLMVDKLQSANSRPQILQMFSSFFACPGGTDNLWELVSIIKGLDECRLSDKYPSGIMHMKHLTMFKSSKAKELGMVRTSKYGGGGIGAPTREESLREAAAIEVRLGNLQQFCELLVQLGEWDRALGVAPGVSMAYWRSLAQRRAKELMQEDNDATVPYAVATGMIDELVGFFSQRGQFHDALVTAVAGFEGSITAPIVGGSTRFHNGAPESSGDSAQRKLVQKTSEELGNWHFRNGHPVLAACCHLAVDDINNALAKLVRGNELELAASVGTVLEPTSGLTHLALELLARRCERLGRWELAIDLLKTVPESEQLLAKCCARCAASLAEIDDLHKRAGFPPTEECEAEAEKAFSQKDIERAVRYYLLSATPEMALEIGLKYVKETMLIPSWTADDVFSILHLMASIQTEKLQQHKCARFRNELMIMCAYVGGLVALRREYYSIVQPLFTHVRFLMHREPTELGILKENSVMAELDAFTAHQAILHYHNPHSSSRREASITLEQKSIYKELLKKAGVETGPLGTGPDCYTGSQYPSHSDVHDSYFTQQRIQGPAYFLEDGRAAIAINDALMWAKVNPFSPLGSGVRINPF